MSTRSRFSFAACALLVSAVALGGCGASPSDGSEQASLYSGPTLEDEENVGEVSLSLEGGEDAGPYYNCAFRMANESYKAPKDRAHALCSTTAVPDVSTDYVFVTQQPGVLLIAFRGTVPSDKNDIAIDLANLYRPYHTNQLTGEKAHGVVGLGWQNRWTGQLNDNGNALRHVIEQFRASNQVYPATGRSEVHFYGHSLGAAVAGLAAFDTFEYLKAKMPNLRVTVNAFNPPKIGNSGLTDQYQRYLIENSGSGAKQQLLFSQFTRAYDAVHNAPPVNGIQQLIWGLNFHPVWNTTPGDKRVSINDKTGKGDRGHDNTTKLPYCPHYQYPDSNAINAHPLGKWEEQLKHIAAISNCLVFSPGSPYLPQPAPSGCSGVAPFIVCT